MKHRKHRWLAGTLAFLLSCSALIPSGNAVFAASKGRVAESETNVLLVEISTYTDVYLIEPTTYGFEICDRIEYLSDNQ